ncbi:hypothetical protein CYK05_08255 [Rothia mucilaginosa]|jgi:hypothetical protein|nr:hypothetical protein CYK05_08255 [Rothia mucilaginosa]
MPRTFMEEGAGHYVSLLTNRVVFPESTTSQAAWRRNNRPDVHVAFAVEHITKHRSGKSYADLLPLRVTGG